jgi:PAS domain S-box-containing protein
MHSDLLDRMHTPVLVLDDTGRVTSANRAGRVVVGETALGGPFTDAFHGVDWGMVLDKTAAGPHTFTLARAGILYSTTITDLGDGRLLAELVAHGAGDELPDLTQTRRMIAALEHSGEAVVITDHNARIVYVNPEFERVMGWSRGEVLGGHNRMWRSGLHPQAFYDAAWERLQAGETWRGELINRRRDGSLIHEDTTISRVTARSGEILGYVEIKRDMTRQRELEQSLAHAQRMESIGTLAGGVAHDYNNVLQTILGHSELILELFGQDAELAGMVGEIRRAAEQSAGLTAQLLAFARRQQVWPKPVETNDELTHLVTMMQRLIGPQIEVRWRPGEGVWPIRIDPAQLGQIVTNICINARDAIADVGRIEIVTANVPVEACAALPLAADEHGEYVSLSIRDDGRGMGPEERERVFEPFFTTKAVGEGTGLGLATVYGIVLQNGGRVFADSRPGEGATFTVLLPRHHGAVEAEVPVPAPAPAERPSQVLVVEDDERILTLVERMLGRAGYGVSACATPAEAIRRARDLPSLDLVIADVIMPDMNGRDTVREIRAHRPDVQVLFVSGYTAQVLKDLPEDERDAHFLQKPFSRDALLARVEALVGAPSGT